MKSAREIVDKMMESDAFSQWMGIEILQAEPGLSQIRMAITPEMVNGFGVCHGGITFAFADSTFAFAANSRGVLSLALENNISYTKKVMVGDVLTATSEEIQNGRTIAVYNIIIHNQDQEIVALFRGTVYRTGEKH